MKTIDEKVKEYLDRAYEICKQPDTLEMITVAKMIQDQEQFEEIRDSINNLVNESDTRKPWEKF